MREAIKTCTVILHPYIDKGKPDRRFRSGYRIRPAAHVRVEFEFLVYDSLHYFRHRQYIFINNYGNYLVTLVDRINSTAHLKLVSLDEMKEINYFESPQQIEFISKGFTVAEGTSYSTPIK